MSEFDVKALMDGMRERLERDQAEGRLAGITVEDLEEAVSHPLAPQAIQETLEAEAVAAREGDRAPDFALPWLPGSGEGRGPTLTLSDHFGRRPVALVFGSYT